MKLQKGFRLPCRDYISRRTILIFITKPNATPDGREATPDPASQTTPDQENNTGTNIPEERIFLKNLSSIVTKRLFGRNGTLSGERKKVDGVGM